MLNVRVNNFSVMLGRSHPFLGITSTFFLGGGGEGGKLCLAQGRNTGCIVLWVFFFCSCCINIMETSPWEFDHINLPL